MAIILEKGQRINLKKSSGSSLTSFCVGCNWGAIVTKGGFLGLGKKVTDVDLDLSCVMLDAAGKLVDHLYSPLYRTDLLELAGLPAGKLDSRERALHHSGDDRAGDQDGDDGLDNEVISVDLSRLSADVQQIVFFLNNCGPEDFAQIPYASIRMYEGTPTKVKEVFASYNVPAESRYQGKRSLIMGKLYKRNGEWKFSAIGDAFEDRAIWDTIKRILESYT